MLALNKCGFVDDDQSIILMCYRENKDMFKINESSWGMPMKQFGGNEHLFLKTFIDFIFVIAFSALKYCLFL